MSYFPENILLIFSHASYWIPDAFISRINPDFLKNNNRLVKNFSDWWTNLLIHPEIPKNQIIKVKFSRAIGDPNRERNADDIFRETDFWGIPIWKTPITKEEKELLLKTYYDIHHQSITNRINQLQKRHKNLLIIDIHDTGNLLMGLSQWQDRKKNILFPPIALCDNEWKTLPPNLREEIDTIFSDHFNIPIQWNDPYRHSFTTDVYGKPDQWIYALQIEFWRYLLIDESSQSPFIWSEKIRDQLFATLCKIGDYITGYDHNIK
jgi:N-formylglutamate amidohydrolase